MYTDDSSIGVLQLEYKESIKDASPAIEFMNSCALLRKFDTSET